MMKRNKNMLTPSVLGGGGANSTHVCLKEIKNKNYGEESLSN